MNDLFRFKLGSTDLGYICAPICILVGLGIGIASVILRQNNTSLAVGLVSAGFSALAATNFTNTSALKINNCQKNNTQSEGNE